MNPLIYILPNVGDIDIKIKYKNSNDMDVNLLKYGHNIFDNNINLNDLSDNEYHKVCKDYDISICDEKNFLCEVKKKFGVEKINQDIIHLWEILYMFDILKSDDNISNNYNEIIKKFSEFKKIENVSFNNKKNNDLYFYHIDDIKEENKIHIFPFFLLTSLGDILKVQNEG